MSDGVEPAHAFHAWQLSCLPVLAQAFFDPYSPIGMKNPFFGPGIAFTVYVDHFQTDYLQLSMYCLLCNYASYLVG